MTEPKAELVAAIDKLTKLSAEDRKIAYSEFVKVHGPAKAQELLEAAKAGDLFQAKAAEITAKLDVAEKAEASNFLPPVVKPDPEPLPSGEVPKPGGFVRRRLSGGGEQKPQPKPKPEPAEEEPKKAAVAKVERKYGVARIERKYGWADVVTPKGVGEIEALTYVPGLTGQIVDWIVAGARRPNRVMALGVIGTLIGRRVEGPTGCATEPPPLKWSDLRYVSDIKEDCNGKEAIQA